MVLQPRLFRAIAVVLLLAGCAGKPVLTPYDGAVSRIQPILVATSRAPIPGNPPSFGSERSDVLHFAEYSISIPPEHQPGDLTLPSSHPNPETDFLAVGHRAFDGAPGFIAALNRQLEALPAGERDVLVMVPGYNNGFPVSVLRAAQLREDYGLTRPLMVFSWPSAEKPTHYVYDRDSVLFARDEFVETLQALARSKASSITILAHSMGALLTMEGLDRLRDRRDRATLARIRGAILAEPDIDIDVFRTQIAGLDLTRMGILVTASHRDRALQLSSFIAGGHPRAGDAGSVEELRRLGVIVVDVSEFDDGTRLGHAAFQQSPELLRLVGSGELTRALDTASAGDDFVVGVLDAVGTMVMAVGYLPYEITR